MERKQVSWEFKDDSTGIEFFFDYVPECVTEEMVKDAIDNERYTHESRPSDWSDEFAGYKILNIRTADGQMHDVTGSIWIEQPDEDDLEDWEDGE